MAVYSNAGYRVISRANALILPNSYRHAAHVMLHSPCGKDKKLFGYYPVHHAVMLQLRFDGTLGFPGGFIEDGESIENGLKRELSEELGPTAGGINFTESDLVISQVCPEKPVCLHFYCKNIEVDVLQTIEKEVLDSPQYGLETLGFVRCPLYTMRDNHGGLPSFLANNFIGNGREQLLKGLKHEGLLSTDEIDEAVLLYKHIKNEMNCGV